MTGTAKRGLVWLAVILLTLGLLGHLLAAYGTGGRAVDYRHHVTGFVLLSVVSGVIVASIGWRFWRGRHDITLVIVGALQALIGLAIYLERFGVAANW
jgi:cell division protein FtsW (lipid II flippase)